MSKSKFALVFIASSALAFAGGAASLVGKNSKTKNFTYSAATHFRFIEDCSENANRQVCECVLGKLQLRYSEEEYQKFDRDLRKNIEHPEFANYIAKSAGECDDAQGTPAPAAYQEESDEDPPVDQAALAAEEARFFVENFKNNVPRKDFVEGCSERIKKMLGKSQSPKSCGCAYDKMLSDKERFADMVLRHGAPAENQFWGAEFMLDCIPEKFTPEIEKNLVNYLNENGAPLSLAKCLVKTIKKEYTLKSFVKASIENYENMAALLLMSAVGCVDVK